MTDSADSLGAESPAGSAGEFSARACSAATCFLLLDAARAPSSRGRASRRTDASRGPVRGIARTAQALARTAVVVFAGRHIPEKNVPALVPALARAREQIPDLRGEIYGDGPEREKLLRAIADHGLDRYMAAPGFVDAEVLEEAVTTSLCLALPSRREGYGLVVMEATARGVSVVVVEGPDNPPPSSWREETAPSPRQRLSAISQRRSSGFTTPAPALRSSAADWFCKNAERLSLKRSLERVLEAYGPP